MSKQGKWLLFSLLLVFTGLAIVSAFWHKDPYFSGAYTPMVEKSQARKRLQESNSATPPSEQPNAMGFAEKDIEKQKGNRYATY